MAAGKHGQVTSRRRMPVFMLACTTGIGLSALHSFLGQLEPSHEQNQANMRRAAKSESPSTATDIAYTNGDSEDSAQHASGTYKMPAGGISKGIAAGEIAGTRNGLARRSTGRPGESPLGAPAHFQVDQTFEVRGVGSGERRTASQGSGT